MPVQVEVLCSIKSIVDVRPSSSIGLHVAEDHERIMGMLRLDAVYSRSILALLL